MLIFFHEEAHLPEPIGRRHLQVKVDSSEGDNLAILFGIN